jgi:hypothetical protein
MGLEIRMVTCDRQADLSSRLGELLTRKGLNVNASRLLFEGLEDRILLNGIPAALIASLPRQTESYGPTTISDAVGDVATASFTLPKFDSHGGMRILVGVVLNSSTTTTTGTYNVVNEDIFNGIVTMSLDLNVDSSVTGVPLTPTFDYTNVASAGTTQPIAVGQTVSVTLPQYTTGSQQHTALYPSSELDDFTAAPGDSTILFEITTSSFADHDANVAVSYYTLPVINYEMTGSVIYEYVMLGTGEEYYQGSKYDFRKPPAAQFQPFYSGTAQPGSTLAVDVLGLGGEVLGSTSTIVDAGGNWAASFYDLGMTGEPHTVSIRQSYAGYTPLTGAGYNLRRYFSPAILGGAYASEHLTVENVLGNRAADVSMAALYSASANPITLGATLYAYEMLPMSACPQGLH